MKIKSIKGLIKTLIATTIISMSIVSVAFADDSVKTIQDFCNKYMIMYDDDMNTNKPFYTSNITNNTNGDYIVTYSDGSWYLCNNTLNLYKFKIFNSHSEIIFNNSNDLYNCVNNYKHIRENNEPKILFNAINFSGMNITGCSDKIYVDNLSTNENLEKYAQLWLKDNYNIKLDIPIYYDDDCLIDGKKKETIYGFFQYDENEKPVCIKIRSEFHNIDILSEKILIHELTHYALNKLNKPYKDTDKFFNNEVLKNGGVTDNGFEDKFYSHVKSNIR